MVGFTFSLSIRLNDRVGQADQGWVVRVTIHRADTRPPHASLSRNRHFSIFPFPHITSPIVPLELCNTRFSLYSLTLSNGSPQSCRIFGLLSGPALTDFLRSNLLHSGMLSYHFFLVLSTLISLAVTSTPIIVAMVSSNSHRNSLAFVKLLSYRLALTRFTYCSHVLETYD